MPPKSRTGARRYAEERKNIHGHAHIEAFNNTIF
jgi:hypothetical protein